MYMLRYVKVCLNKYVYRYKIGVLTCNSTIEYSFLRIFKSRVKEVKAMEILTGISTDMNWNSCTFRNNSHSYIVNC